MPFSVAFVPTAGQPCQIMVQRAKLSCLLCPVDDDAGGLVVFRGEHGKANFLDVCGKSPRITSMTLRIL
jgi:hypothetical protein